MAFVDWIRLIVLAMLWGWSYLFIEIALVSAEPMTIVYARISIAAACLIVYCRVAGIRVNLTWPLLMTFAVMGILNNVIPFNLIAFGQTRITGGVASILNATTPLFTVIVAHLWPGGEPATPSRVTGVIIGFLGVGVLIGLGHFDDIANELPGQIAMLLAAFSYALSALWGRRLSDVPPLAAAGGMLAASTVLMAPAMLTFGAPTAMPSIGAIGAIIGLAVFSSAIAYGIFFKLIGTIGSNVMLVTFLMPAMAITLGVIFLGEEVEARHLVGLALILCGLALVDGRVLQLFRRGAPTD